MEARPSSQSTLTWAETGISICQIPGPQWPLRPSLLSSELAWLLGQLLGEFEGAGHSLPIYKVLPEKHSLAPQGLLWKSGREGYPFFCVGVGCTLFLLEEECRDQSCVAAWPPQEGRAHLRTEPVPREARHRPGNIPGASVSFRAWSDWPLASPLYSLV